MKQLIEEQGQTLWEKSYARDLGMCGVACECGHCEIRRDIINKIVALSNKQLIDELIARESEIVNTMEDYYPEFKFRMGLISGKNETISHLKKLKEELN